MIGGELEQATLARYRPMSCERCGSVGTIVEMGLCCRVHELSALGGIWDMKDWRRMSCKRPSGRRRRG